MGFMGLSHWSESDNAADFHSKLYKAINKAFLSELKRDANVYNTPGYINVMLMIKSNPSLANFISTKILSIVSERINSDNGYLRIKGGKELLRDYTKIITSGKVKYLP